VTAGNPLYTLELTRHLVETSNKNQYGTDHPDHLYSIIRNRISDLAAQTTHIIKIAAVIGKPFSIDDLAAITSIQQYRLLQSLEELLNRNLLIDQYHACYDFHHACIRDAVYADLSKPKRMYLHKRIAEHYANIADNNSPEIISRTAFHYRKAGIAIECYRWYKKAADHAQSVFACAEGIDCLRYAQTHLEITGESHMRMTDHHDRCCELLVARGHLAALANGYGAQSVAEVCDKLEQLLPRVKNQRLAFAAKQRIRIYLSFSSKLSHALRYANDLVEVANQIEKPELRLEAYRGRGFVQYQLGRFSDAIESLDTSTDLAEDSISSGYFNTDHAPFSLMHANNLLALVLLIRGFSDRSKSVLKRNSSYTTEHLNDYLKGTLLLSEANAHQEHGDISELQAISKQFQLLNLDNNLPKFSCFSGYFSGWALAKSDDASSGITRMKEAITQYKSLLEEANKPSFRNFQNHATSH